MTQFAIIFWSCVVTANICQFFYSHRLYFLNLACQASQHYFSFEASLKYLLGHFPLSVTKHASLHMRKNALNTLWRGREKQADGAGWPPAVLMYVFHQINAQNSDYLYQSQRMSMPRKKICYVVANDHATTQKSYCSENPCYWETVSPCGAWPYHNSVKLHCSESPCYKKTISHCGERPYHNPVKLHGSESPCYRKATNPCGENLRHTCHYFQQRGEQPCHELLHH